MSIRMVLKNSATFVAFVIVVIAMTACASTSTADPPQNKANEKRLTEPPVHPRGGVRHRGHTHSNSNRTPAKQQSGRPK